MQLEMFSAYIASNFAGHLVHVPLVVSIFVYVTCDSRVSGLDFRGFLVDLVSLNDLSGMWEVLVGTPDFFPFLCHVCIFCDSQ